MPIRLLAVDTALGACSAAVLEGDVVRAHCLVAMERGHAESLAPMVEETMREAGLAFGDLDRLAVTTGPGTFTGQRVGLAFMRGLRVALKKPLTGITTLNAMAAAAMAEAHTSGAAVLHDAKRGEVYVLGTESSGIIVPLQLAKFEDAVAAIAANMSGNTLLAFAGTAGELAVERFRALGGSAIQTTIRQPDALWVARLAQAALEPAEVPKPLYLRAPDAKLPADASSAFRLRDATQDDLVALAALHTLCFAQGWSAPAIGQLLRTPGAFAVMAENAGAARGFVIVRVAGDEAEILSIGVTPQVRRSGTGRKLVSAGAEKARNMGAATLFLEVARENEAARALYAAAGFTEAGLRRGYYREPGAKPEDALILRANLPLP